MKLDQLKKNVEDHILELEQTGVEDITAVKAHLQLILKHLWALHHEYETFREQNG